MIQQQRQSSSRNGSRKHSPQPQVPTSPHLQRTQRLYSFDEVREWCDKLLESKFKYLTLEIAENTEVIRQLNERLSHNERELERKEKLLNAIRDGQLASTSGAIVPVSTSTVDLTNKITGTHLEDKLSSINSLLKETERYRQAALQPTQATIDGYQLHMENWIDSNMNMLKGYIKDKCQAVRKHNSEYWHKIKSWVILFEERLKRCEGAIQATYDETQSINLGEDFMGLYRLKNYQARFRELEEAVVDMEEGFKLAAETQAEMRDLLWENDQADFLQGKQLSEIAESYPIRPTASQPVRVAVQNRGSLKDKLFGNIDTISPLAKRNSNPREEIEIPLNNDFNIIEFEQPAVAEELTNPVDRVTTPQPTEESELLLRQRVSNTIVEHKLETPLPCYLDEFHYLKSDRSTYLFDQLGEMIKMSPAIFNKFCQQGLLLPIVPT